jgi:two-component system osmolarity sensor histidine kinase EnvZ
VNLSRAALRQADGINRVALVKSLGSQEAIRVTPREPGDRWEPFEVDRFTRRVGAGAARHAGARRRGGAQRQRPPGMWVGFTIDRDAYWLQAEASRGTAAQQQHLGHLDGHRLLATFGSVAIASLINRPLRQLSFAASRIREGDLDSRLDENTLTSEIREVNMGFNRMARELARVEEDRAVMLAGISHDLRTPLARLRLETEMSVDDDEAKRNMAMDIDQLDAIIDKFMDYARPGETQLQRCTWRS